MDVIVYALLAASAALGILAMVRRNLNDVVWSGGVILLAAFILSVDRFGWTPSVFGAAGLFVVGSAVFFVTREYIARRTRQRVFDQYDDDDGPPSVEF